MTTINASNFQCSSAYFSTESTASAKRSGMVLLHTEECLVWYAIVLAYVFYLMGLLYIVGSVIGWSLFALIVLRAFVKGAWPKDACIPVVVWVWIAGMAMMLVALLVAHADYNMSMGQTIKSSIGWAKGWALLALFPLLGAMASVRPEVIVRACCILAAQSIPFVMIGIALAVVGFQGPLYLSPFKAIGGPISAFEVNLFGLNPETGKPRWPFLAPWAPAAGLLSCLFLVICTHESSKFWRRAGITGALVMCLFCQSRAGWALFLALGPALYCYRHVRRPGLILFCGVLFSSLVLFGQPVVEKVAQVHQDIKDSRADSTRVRAALANIALQRWESEAPVWGHGIVEKGPKIVEHMPIGSHHSWYGLLFVKGIVGLFALAVPLAITMTYLLVVSLGSHRAQSAMLLMAVLLGYSFFENLEILAYLYWPALLWIGIILNPMKLVAYDQKQAKVFEQTVYDELTRASRA